MLTNNIYNRHTPLPSSSCRWSRFTTPSMQWRTGEFICHPSRFDPHCLNGTRLIQTDDLRRHQSLLMIGIGVLGTLMNTYGAKHLPVLEGIVLIVHIFGFFCIIIPLWVLAPKAPASEVFGTFSNFGGWSTVGAACFVGSITATGSFAGSDAAVHLSEETKDASKSVPRMIIFTIVLNGLMGLVFIITYVCSVAQFVWSTQLMSAYQCFCITNLEAVVTSSSPFPFMDVSGHTLSVVIQPVEGHRSGGSSLTAYQQVFMAGTNSKAATVSMSTIPLILSVCTSLNALAAASRQAWSLARDQALPFSSWFRKVGHVSHTQNNAGRLTSPRSQRSALPSRSTRSCSLCQSSSSSH